MGNPISLVLDCADPLPVGAFWRQAFGYLEADPPAGHASWTEVAPRPSEEERRRIDAGDPEGNEFCLV